MRSPANASNPESPEEAAAALFAQLPAFDVIDGELMPRRGKAWHRR